MTYDLTTAKNILNRTTPKSGNMVASDGQVYNIVDLIKGGMPVIPSKATISQTKGSGLTLSVDKDDWEAKITTAGSYVFKAEFIEDYLVVKVGEEPEEGEPDERPEVVFHYVEGGGEYPETYECWEDADGTKAYTTLRTPSANDVVYSEPDVQYGNVKEYVAPVAYWTFNGEKVDLSDYGITVTGTVETNDEITVVYAKAYSSYVVPTTNTTKGGYSIPDLTADQVTQIYNCIVSGHQPFIKDANEVYYSVSQVDSINDEIQVQILYFDTLIITYTLDNDTVTITAKKLTTTDVT